MVRTKIERVEVEQPDAAVLRIEGKLGYHEKSKVSQLIDECIKRNFRKVVFDFSEVTSLGGGVAKILREFVATHGERGGVVSFVVTNDIVLKFLASEEGSIRVCGTLDEALQGGGSQPQSGEPIQKEGESKREEEVVEQPARPEGAREGSEGSNVILMSYNGGTDSVSVETGEDGAPESESGEADGGESEEQDGKGGRAAPQESDSRAGDLSPGSERVISEIFSDDSSTSAQIIEKTISHGHERPEATESGDDNYQELNRSLRRRIFGYRTLFSISADFGAIRDEKKLLDIFLLTTIAQGGVESALFCENRGDSFETVMSKGLETETAEDLKITAKSIKLSGDGRNVIPIDSFVMNEMEREELKKKGFEFICPFQQKNKLVGLVLLGKRIAGRGMRNEDFEFLSVLINITQGAYENALSFEREQDRTLGIVKTLISLIEENTLLKGTSEFISRYVGMVAKDLNYPEEDFKDLIYGTVLRDMGMIKISDLILRSPRDLTKEEWEIIKKHPEDGSEMLRRMQFNDHVVEIVKSHHERFNGEGYPRGLRGKEIPLGARIISVVESYAAMISERPNRPARSEKEALDSLKENYGLRYDREVVMRFVKIMETEIAKSVVPEVSVT